MTTKNEEQQELPEIVVETGICPDCGDPVTYEIDADGHPVNASHIRCDNCRGDAKQEQPVIEILEPDPSKKEVMQVEPLPVSTVPEPVKNEIVATSQGMVSAEAMDHMWRQASMLARSDCLPQSYKGKAENAMIAMHYGARIGMDGLVACQNIMIVNNRPCLWGDMPKALVMRSGLCTGFREWSEGSFEDGTYTTYCEAKRKGYDPVVNSFSVDDAKKAGLYGQNVHATHPKRMYKYRARSFTIRDLFPDIMMGLFIKEELEDIEDAQQAQPALTLGDVADKLTADAEGEES